MASIADILGYAVGAVTPGSNVQVKAAAAAAKISSDISAKAKQIGTQIGAKTGSGIFQSLATGAAASDSKATTDFVDKNVPQVAQYSTYLYIALAVLVVWLFFLRRK